MLGESSKTIGQWIPTNGADGNSVNSFAANGSNLFAGTAGGGVYRSTDRGSNWSAVNSGMTITHVTSLINSGQDIFAGNFYAQIYLSTNNGDKWTNLNVPMYNEIRSLLVNGNNLFAGTGGSGVYISTDNGASWKPSNNGLSAKYINILTINGGNIFAGGDGLFRTTNNGKNWVAINTGLTGTIFSLAFMGSKIFAGTRDGTFKSTDNGYTWTPLTVTPGVPEINALVADSNNLFAGTFSGVYLSTNGGSSWNTINDELTDLDINSLAVIGSNIFAGTFYGDVTGVWRRPLSDFGISAVQSNPSPQLSLKNFPNPFSSQTTISFLNPERQFVDIRVVDLLGKESAHLFSGALDGGKHTYVWNASLVPSGVYFCAVRTPSGEEKYPLVVEH